MINFIAWLKHINHTQSTSSENKTFHTILLLLLFFLYRLSENYYYFFIFQNGTWYHLSVHAAPNFVVVPKDIVYVGIGDNIILNCQVKSITEVFAETTNDSNWLKKYFNFHLNFFITWQFFYCYIATMASLWWSKVISIALASF